jgi:hypothetical protein
MNGGTMGKAAAATGQVLLIGAAILASLYPATGAAASADPSHVAAIFPPWWPQARAIAAAGSAGDILGVGAAPFVILVHGDPATLQRKARSAGALIVFSSERAGLCSSLFLEPKP